MMQPNRNSYRYSWNSCATEDSTESASLATPLSVSPCPQPNTLFPNIITVADEDTYITRFHIPDIAAVATNRHRQETRQQQQQPFSNPTSPEPSGIQIMQNAQPPPLSFTLLSHQQQQYSRYFEQNDQELHATSSMSSPPPPSLHQQPNRMFWPRIKRILSNSSLIPNNHSSDNHSRKKKITSQLKSFDSNEDESESNRKWFDIKKSRIHPF
ncbi:hypothetical protein BJ944DRAFT_258628 [Cunninghamella echinulata]|nr:hypothetical protein BJ944DRAFT_258628 [Cunninghamella echinulata]